MTPYIYIIYPEKEIQNLWADSIEEAKKEAESKMVDGQFGFICQFGSTDKIELGKRAVN